MSDEKNTKPLSMRRIKALKALCKKATLAPWEDKREPSLTEDGEELRRYYHIESKKGTICELFYNEDWEAMGCYNNDAVDAAFIAAARQAVPDLLAEVERLRVENQRLEQEADFLAEHLHRSGVPCPGDGEKFDPYGECAEKGWPCVACFREWARQETQEGESK